MKSVYIRTSTTEQSPEIQLNDIKTLLKGTYDVYRDQQSAWKDNLEREAFNRLKLQIRFRKVDELYVWDLDRLYRNRKKLIEFFKYCKAYGCNIISYRQQWLYDLKKIPEPFNEMMHDMMLQVMGWLAEEESSKKSERIKNSIRIKEDGAYSYQGKKWGRKQLSTQKKHKITILHTSGLSIRDIAKELNVSVGGVHKTITEFKGGKQ